MLAHFSACSVLAGLAGIADVVGRVMEALGGQSENLATVFGYTNGVFELRGELAVAGDGGPTVRQDLDLWPAEIDHWFDCKQHAGFQDRAFALFSVVQNVGAVVIAIGDYGNDLPAE